MKKTIIGSALALSLIGFAAPQVHAIDLGVDATTNAQIQIGPDGKRMSGDATMHDEVKTKVMGEKDRLQNMNQVIMDRVQQFKQNLAKIKSAPIGEKKTFIVTAYTDTYNFFVKTHDNFVIALDKAEAKGINVSEARAHFKTAWDLLQTANADLNSFTKLDVKTATISDARTLAKKIEAGYIKVRQEMHAGAEAFKVAIKAHHEASVSTGEADEANN